MTQSHPHRFLFLQGPHGPFFRQLAQMLRASGASVWRVGFNAGDAAFWGRAPGYIPYTGTLQDWPEKLADLLAAHQITDIVLYGDTRPVHAQAVAQARAAGIRIHVFEEGYLRPYWITYERNGSNGHSRLMDLTLEDMAMRLARSGGDMPTPPAHWGDMKPHIFYGAVYHWFVMFWNRRYPHFKPHRALKVHREALLYSKRLLLMPFQSLLRSLSTFRIKRGGFPYHMALLQLEHDASFQAHSPFTTMADFIDVVIDGFAKGAPQHHHLVFKAHPLDSGQLNLPKLIAKSARAHGIAARTHYVRGGKLAHLLTDARTAVTVNSTAGQQVLWRGIPLRIFGTSVYDKPQLVSHQPLADFFAKPDRPDAEAYRSYRRYLLDTSQVPGGFYARSSRQQALRHLVDMMLAHADPYDAQALRHAPAPTRLKAVK